MRRANMEIAAVNAALEDGEIALHGVRMGVTAHIFFGGVVHDFMAEIAAHVAVMARVGGRGGGGLAETAMCVCRTAPPQPSLAALDPVRGTGLQASS